MSRTTIIVACILGGCLFGLHLADKHYAVKAAQTVLVAKYEKDLNTAYKQSKEKQEAMQLMADKSREEKNEAIEDISNQLSVALKRLSMRTQRPITPTPSQDSPVVQTCTARELYREDAEFLTRESARAQSVIVERDYYYQEYEAVRNKLNGTTK